MHESIYDGSGAEPMMVSIVCYTQIVPTTEPF